VANEKQLLRQTVAAGAHSVSAQRAAEARNVTVYCDSRDRYLSCGFCSFTEQRGGCWHRHCRRRSV